MVKLHVERTIAASPERVFEWLADPANLTAAPLALRAGFVKGSSGPCVGAVREVTGLGMWFREEITAYDAPRNYSYRILRAFPAMPPTSTGRPPIPIRPARAARRWRWSAPGCSGRASRRSSPAARRRWSYGPRPLAAARPGRNVGQLTRNPAAKRTARPAWRYISTVGCPEQYGELYGRALR
jgi:hypothetical protein